MGEPMHKSSTYIYFFIFSYELNACLQKKILRDSTIIFHVQVYTMSPYRHLFNKGISRQETGMSEHFHR